MLWWALSDVLFFYFFMIPTFIQINETKKKKKANDPTKFSKSTSIPTSTQNPTINKRYQNQYQHRHQHKTQQLINVVVPGKHAISKSISVRITINQNQLKIIQNQNQHRKTPLHLW